ncbi:hypothetical protein Fmac_004504 [Flemingia macrophylla]|uniref:Uncharacterized protein n=1 Tax=Flemingia macrophylla TaxID=520843 RepID=A0ABD1N536_9FABA
MSTMAMAMATAMSVSCSGATSLSLLKRNNPSSISCIGLSRSSLSYAFNPLRFPLSSILISISFVPSLSHFAFPLSDLSFVATESESSPTPRSATEAQAFASSATLPLLSLLRICNSSLPFPQVLILAKGTAVPKSFIVPLFALQAPAGVVSWIKGRYGVWTAFLALLVRLFFFIPGELELPFLALLLVMIAPYEAMKLRDTKEGAAISLLIAAYLAFQHFSRTSLEQSFDQGSIVATLAVIGITVASVLLLV